MIQTLLLVLVPSASATMEPFIVGGKEVGINKWPFIAFIHVTLGDQVASACGGSLLSSQTVLTAAHCVDDLTDSKKNMKIFKFHIFMGHSSYLKATLSRKVIDYTSHKNYKPDDDDVRADIAVMFLKNPVQFSANVKKVLLLQRNFNNVKDSMVEVAGWGATSIHNQDTGMATKLKAAPLIAMDTKTCRKTIKTIVDKVICTKPSRNFAYSGDSGGPLVKRNSAYQVGIVSFRDEDAEVTAFTSIPAYFKWINDTQYKLYRKYCPNKVRGVEEEILASISEPNYTGTQAATEIWLNGNNTQ